MELLGLPWRCAAADVAEESYLLAQPMTSALNVALAKARAVHFSTDEVLLAADTLVVCDGEVLGKPADEVAAAGMLSRLRARAHAVLTGVALKSADGREWGGVVETRVWMRAYSNIDVQAYIARGEPFDKAGGYAIQDTAFRPVERLEGCYLNVVGLPLCAVAAGLEALSVSFAPPAARRAPCDYCRLGAPLVEIAQRFSN